MKDYIFRLPDRQHQKTDRTQIKKAVAAIFGDRHDGASARYLFSPEPRHELGPWIRVRTCVNGLDVDPSIAREIEITLPRRGTAVEVIAWVGLKQKFPISQDARARAKLSDMRSHFEGALEVHSVSVVGALELANIERGKSKFQRAFGRIRLTGLVKDQEALEAVMKNGIGAAKAYGFGLVDIQEIEND